MTYDKGYDDLMFAIVEQSLKDLIKALCEREYYRNYLGSMDRRYSALSEYRKHDYTVKEVEKFLKGPLVSLSEFNGPRLLSSVYKQCKDMNYDYDMIKKSRFNNDSIA